jgi:hypothetical protein
MTYSDFTLDMLAITFNLALTAAPLFEHAPASEPSPWLKETLERGMQLPLSSEKARSELIVMPILLGWREQSQNRVSIYSGQRLDADPARGLIGECDFIITHTPPIPVIQSPIVTIVEAKKHDIDAGWGQCAAQMVGAHIFNQHKDHTMPAIFGCVTTGEIWQFLKLENDVLCIDSDRYYINAIERILGVLQAIETVYHSFE